MNTNKENETKPCTIQNVVVSSSNTLEEIESVENCPNCGSDAVGYDGSDGFFECFQCDNEWMA